MIDELKKLLWDKGMAEHEDKCDVENPDDAGPLAAKLARAIVEAGWTPPNPMTPFRVFVLHDGEDAERTKDLHKFMEGVDWEGESDGIVVWLHVMPGDIIRRGEHSLGVVFGRRREK